MNPKKWRLHLHVHRQLFAWQHNSTQEVLQWQKLHEDSIFFCWCWKVWEMSQKGRTKFIQKQSIFPPEVHRLLIKSSLDSQWLPRETSKFLMTHDSSMHMFMFFSPFEDISNLNLAQKKDMKFVKRRGTCNLCHHLLLRMYLVAASTFPHSHDRRTP